MDTPTTIPTLLQVAMFIVGVIILSGMMRGIAEGIAEIIPVHTGRVHFWCGGIYVAVVLAVSRWIFG